MKCTGYILHSYTTQRRRLSSLMSYETNNFDQSFIIIIFLNTTIMKDFEMFILGFRIEITQVSLLIINKKVTDQEKAEIFRKHYNTETQTGFVNYCY